MNKQKLSDFLYRNNIGRIEFYALCLAVLLAVCCVVETAISVAIKHL